MGTKIIGCGAYIPENAIDNFVLSKYMETSDEWIRERTGIIKRHFANPDEATSDLAYKAALNLFEENKIDPSTIDYIIFATMTPDCYFPGSSPFFQRKLNLKSVPCLEIRGQCAGFLFGMQLANSLLKAGNSKRVLLVGAEVHTCLFPYEPLKPLLERSFEELPKEYYELNTSVRDRMVLFGDGAGCFLLEKKDGGGIIDSIIYTDGNMAEKLMIKGGGSSSRPFFKPEDYKNFKLLPVLEGREVFKLAVTLMPKVVMEILEKNNYSINDLNLLIMHQANLRINEAVQKKLGLDDNRVFNNIQKYGNTTAATIPLAFYEAKKEGRIKEGDLICFVALGSGLHWGAILYRA